MNANWKKSLALCLPLTMLLSFGAPALAAESPVTLEQAKSIALEHAGLEQKSVTFTQAKLEYDDGRKVYEIEFFQGRSEYDYEISYSSGRILDYDYDAQTTLPPASKRKISLEQAKAAALKHAGRKQEDVIFVQEELDYDDGQAVYELEFYSADAEYDYEVSASTGKILSCDYDAESHIPEDAAVPSSKPATTASASNITLEQAKAIALKHAGLSADQVRFTKAKKDHDDGRTVYEIEFEKGRMEYEYEISVSTGKILEWDKEYDD